MNDLLYNYSLIEQVSSYTVDSKKEGTTAAILMLILKEQERYLSSPIADLCKSKVNELYNDGILSTFDSRSRKQQIKKLAKTIHPRHSYSDLTNLLEHNKKYYQGNL